MTTRNALVRLLGAAATAGALAWAVLAQGGAAAGSPAEAVADDAPGYAVEDYAYPDADKILAVQDIVLKRGDGHIVLADCAAGADLLRFLARDREDVCFAVTADTGFLTLELPSVHGVKTDDSANTHLEMTAEDDQVEYDIPADTWAGVGESVDGREHVLVEIHVTN
ncbi:MULTISPECIES: hypothetical protein [Streptomyces]|uniref:Secreted protein n=2 Tax=Streptomyces TaxID=1883 RepID=A0ABU3IZY9_9ACTN|nr:hypothetical protein [Streptomyces thermodiastaticus]MDT6968389.1 hypothetical protein [Streptomyces thermocarboxydus]MDX3417288.1 hypothetical protein [Streptomyces sp. MD20-1-1]MYQ31693.1 hypothetical protein [Streptomyces sp. SID4956]WSB44031.1 hypothetical protein OG853_25635 [Streptomyces cellulosae]